MRIDRIDVFPARYPVEGYFKFFESPGGYGRAAVFVKVTADDGTIGWGQSVPVELWSYETPETATIVLRDYYAPALIGHDPRDIAGANQIMDRVIRPGFTTGMPLARAGIDLALHDLTGRAEGRSLAAMWNRPEGGRVTLSWTINVRSLDEVDARIEEGRSRGYRNFNIKVAPDLEFDAALTQRVRDLAPETFLWADANGGYDPETAMLAAPALAEAGADVLEAPVRPNYLTTYQKLARQGALPILMDEGVISPVELQEFMRLKMLDGVAIKPPRCGGLLAARRQLQLIEENGLMWLGSGLTDPDISLAASLGLFAAHGLRKPAALNGPQFLVADVLAKPIEVVDGEAIFPTGPGLGVEVDERKVKELVAASAG
jgi:L-alanine-DL-glutamate epimerase-like enolase superfamily enzyme